MKECRETANVERGTKMSGERPNNILYRGATSLKCMARPDETL